MPMRHFTTDGVNFRAIRNDLRMQLGLDWTANRFAQINYSKSKAGENGYTDFNWFHFTNK